MAPKNRMAVTIAVTVAVLLLVGCAYGGPRGDAPAPDDREPGIPTREETTAPREQRGTMVEETRSSGVLAPPNDKPVPDVVGMKAENACRALSRSGYSGGIFGEAPGAVPGHVVKQAPKPGYMGGEGQLVHLTVSGPFRDALARGSACVDRRAERPEAISPAG